MMLKLIRTRTFLIAAVIALHFALSPGTVNLMSYVSSKAHEYSQLVSSSIFDKQHQKQLNGFMSELLRTKEEPSAPLLDTIDATREWLKTRHCELSLVLLPSRSTVLDETGQPKLHGKTAAKLMAVTQRELEKRGHHVLSAMPDVYLGSFAPDANLFLDHIHFTPEGNDFLASLLEKRFGSKILDGSTMLMGDCFALTVAKGLKNLSPEAQARAFWKNGSSNVVAFELSKAPKEELDGIKEVIWILNDSYLDTKKPDYFPKPVLAEATAGKPIVSGIRRVKAKLTDASQVSGARLSKATYPNALVQHKFQTENEILLGIRYIMKDKVQDGAVMDWHNGAVLFLDIQPWEEAVREHPEIGREQVLDDLYDFTTPRFFIVNWIYSTSL
jgi:hypothetical protein